MADTPFNKIGSGLPPYTHLYLFVNSIRLSWAKELSRSRKFSTRDGPSIPKGVIFGTLPTKDNAFLDGPYPQRATVGMVFSDLLCMRLGLARNSGSFLSYVTGDHTRWRMTVSSVGRLHAHTDARVIFEFLKS